MTTNQIQEGTMTDETYNGWKNYETWAVGMFLDGNYDGPGTYYAALEAVRTTLEDVDHPTSEYWTEEESKRYGVADRLKDLVTEYVNPESYDDDHPDPKLHPLVSDILGAALSDVDWHELADAWIQAASE
jgi:hypothetical protein